MADHDALCLGHRNNVALVIEGERINGSHDSPGKYSYFTFHWKLKGSITDHKVTLLSHYKLNTGKGYASYSKYSTNQ